MKPKVENPLQGKLFMSAREILATHDPNEPDRKYHGTNASVTHFSSYVRNIGPDPREGQPTARPFRTDETPNVIRQMGLGNNPDPQPDKRYARPFRDLKVEAKPETDQQLWDRKLEESNRPTSLGSLTERIAREGVRNPIALSTETTGHTGKPNIAGGHHRVAVMAHLNPDQLLPVVPVKNVVEANESGL